MAMASTALPSASVMEPSTIIEATVLPALVKSPSSMAVRVGVSSASIGASLTELTVIEAVSVAVL